MKRARTHHPAMTAAALVLASCTADPSVLEPAPTRVEPPPGDVLVQPGPDAANELDPSLFAGLPPQARAELGLPAASTSSMQDTRKSPPSATSTNRRASGASRDKSVKIASVAVLEVKGAPGRGNAELARALRLVLRKAGWPVHARARRDSMRISGQVSLGPKTPRGQRVDLKWIVRAPNGKVLGIIRQNNVVPSGSLDEGFGAAALPAAEGAADGIFQIVRRLRQG